tara:strand:- start:142 stop:687 length:546 start_codon:yes stop_codon:yes gene_type:complete
MDVKKNYLPLEKFEFLKNSLRNHWFPWGFVPFQVLRENSPKTAEEHQKNEFYSSPDINDWHLTHLAFDGVQESEHRPIFDDLVYSLTPKNIYRVKANLLLPNGEHTKSSFHTDIEGQESIPDTANVSIYYLNTCNGYTELEDGTKINCEENKLITIGANIKHSAVRQTDTKTRYVINIVWA